MNNSIWYDLLSTTGSRNLSNRKIFEVIFFSNEGSFLHLFNSRIELKFIELCLAIRITVYGRSVASRMTEVQSLTILFITCDQAIGLPNHVIR